MSEKENINFFLFETERENESIDLSELLIQLNNCSNTNFEKPYLLKYTVKELLLISEYYGLSKNLKTNKSNKEEIINILIEFENNVMNKEIVLKRKKIGFYLLNFYSPLLY